LIDVTPFAKVLFTRKFIDENEGRQGRKRKILMTSILVTGGAGYIGSHNCRALRRAGFVALADLTLRISARGIEVTQPLMTYDLLSPSQLLVAV